VSPTQFVEHRIDAFQIRNGLREGIDRAHKLTSLGSKIMVKQHSQGWIELKQLSIKEKDKRVFNVTYGLHGGANA
jgi:hypothetical protein